MTSRKVWRIDKAGSLSRLKMTEENLPELEDGQVQVSVRAIGLNFADVFACMGLYSATPKEAFIPGLEFSGVVVKSRANQTNYADFFKPGDRVMGVSRFGSYATVINASPNQLQILPSGWTFTEGAALIVQSLTAWHALKNLGDLQADQTALIHSAAGGVGLWAVRLAKALGVKIVATIGSVDKAPLLKEKFDLHPSQIIVRQRKKFVKQLVNALENLNESGFDLVLDAIYGEYFKPGYKLMKPAGRYVIYGASSMSSPGDHPSYLKLIIQYLKRPKLDPLAMISENKSLMGFNLIWLWDQIEKMPRMIRSIRELAPEPPIVSAVYQFYETRKALAFLQSGGSTGKVVVETTEKD